jgi:hypothetical protein
LQFDQKAGPWKTDGPRRFNRTKQKEAVAMTKQGRRLLD